MVHVWQLTLKYGPERSMTVPRTECQATMDGAGHYHVVSLAHPTVAILIMGLGRVIVELFVMAEPGKRYENLHPGAKPDVTN